MIVFYRNYKRTERTLLCIQSVRHLFPDIDIRCLLTHDNDASEYDHALPYFDKLNVKVYHHKKIYNFGLYGENYNNEFTKQEIVKFRQEQSVAEVNGPGNVVDGRHYGPSYGYFTIEYLNKIQSLLRDVDDKVLVVDEDHFFTTGETINFLKETDYDFACGLYSEEMQRLVPSAPKSENREHIEARGLESNRNFVIEEVYAYHVNGNIQSFNPKKLDSLFPLIPNGCIEPELTIQLLIPCVRKGYNVVSIPTRCYGLIYPRDGAHVNGVQSISAHLTQHKIPFEIFGVKDIILDS